VTLAERRLAELDALDRELTDAEQREAMMRARQARNNVSRRRKYFLEPAYRESCIARTRAYREARA
jgi:hypothetical protein